MKKRKQPTSAASLTSSHWEQPLELEQRQHENRQRQLVAHLKAALAVAELLFVRILPSDGGAEPATAPASCEKDDTDIYTPQEVAKGRRLYGVAAAKKAAPEPGAGDGRRKRTPTKFCEHATHRLTTVHRDKRGRLYCLYCVLPYRKPSPRPRG